MVDSNRKRRGPLFLHSRMISIISISMVLFLVGLIASLFMIGGNLTDYVRERFTVTLFTDNDVTERELAQLSKELERMPFVSTFEYYSKEEAIQAISKELGENPETFLGWNPFSPSYELHLKPEYLAVRDSIDGVIATLGALSNVDQVNFRNDMLGNLNDNIQKVAMVMLVLTILLLLISIVLINNTVRLQIYARRFSIYTMRLVGATSWFIKRPFIVASLWDGLVASVISIVLLVWGWYYLTTKYPVISSVIDVYRILVVVGIVLCVGLLISSLSANGAVRKFLRMSSDKLYKA